MRKSSFPNIVGYQTVDAPAANSYKAFAVQFTEVSGETTIKISELMKFTGTAKGAPTAQDSADQIWKWDSGTSSWVKYYWKLPNKAWAREWDKAVCTDADTIKNGETFFFKRSSSAGSESATLTFSGAIHELSAQPTYSDIVPNSCNFMSYPWPVELKIMDFAKYQGTPKGAPTAQDSADQIWLWDTTTSDWVKYYYKLPNKAWAKATDKSLCTDADVIPAGEGFFFKRSTSASGNETITFKGPGIE